MFHKIKNIEILEKQIIKAYFEDGKIIYYDMNKAIKKIKDLEPLKNENIFKKGHIDAGGYGIVWNDEIDISSEELYVNGVNNLKDLKK